MKWNGSSVSSGTAFQKCWITTSWDDGHPLDLRIGDLLNKYGLTGTFYVPRAAEQEVMAPDQIRHLCRKFEIGAHTLDHTYLDSIPDTTAMEQIIGSRRWVEDLTGKECRSFCFPGGKFRKFHLKLVSEAGFRAARTVELLNVQGPQWANNLWLIPTTIQVFPHSRIAYARNAFKRRKVASLLRLRTLLLSTNWVAIARELLLQISETGGTFHLWGHSWEIDREQQWQPLEDLFSTLKEYQGRFLSVTNGQLSSMSVPSASAKAVLTGSMARTAGRHP